jgi:hypothetical protein
MVSYDLDGTERRDSNYVDLVATSPEGGTFDLVVRGRGTDLPEDGTISSYLEQADKPHAYRIRVSSLWAWWATKDRTLEVRNTGRRPIDVQELAVRDGD